MPDSVTTVPAVSTSIDSALTVSSRAIFDLIFVSQRAFIQRVLGLDGAGGDRLADRGAGLTRLLGGGCRRPRLRGDGRFNAVLAKPIADEERRRGGNQHDDQHDLQQSSAIMGRTSRR